ARVTMDGMDKEELRIRIVLCTEVSSTLGEDECSEI
ncbi:hypothetical protein Tco_1381220, partial [Tanacetum coccineum]